MSKEKPDYPAIVFEFRDEDMHMDHVGFAQNKMSVWHLFQTWLLLSDLILQELKGKPDKMDVGGKILKALKLFEVEHGKIDDER